MPIRENGKATYILFDKHLEPNDILSYLEMKNGMNIQLWRYICAAFVFVGELLRYEDQMPFPVISSIFFTYYIVYASLVTLYCL